MQDECRVDPLILESEIDFEYTMALTAPQVVANVEVEDKYQVGTLDNMLAAFDLYHCDNFGPNDPQYPSSNLEGYNNIDCGTLSAPKVLLISFTCSEADFSSTYLQRQCLEYLKLGMMGITHIVNTSDHGTLTGIGIGCVDDRTGESNATTGKFSPNFPSSCPRVTTVSGTQLLPPPNTLAAADDRIVGNLTTETTFRKVSSAGQVYSSGGGLSNVFPVPSYQVSKVARYKSKEQEHLAKLEKRFSNTGRGYPDVAALANSYMVVVNGTWRTTSGTSASTLAFASIVTFINSERLHLGKNPDGFINPALYNSPEVLNDVSTSANQGCGVDEAFRATTG